MKYGQQLKQLANPKYLNHCIAYGVLKKSIKVVVSSAEAAEPATQEEHAELGDALGQPAGPFGGQLPDSRFSGLLEHELTKVNRFFALELRTLFDSFREAEGLLFKPGGEASEETLARIEQIFDRAAADMVELEHFRRLNFTGFRKIAKKFDKASQSVGGGRLSSLFVPRLVREFFIAVPFEPYLLALAQGYAALRQRRRGGDPGPRASSPVKAPAAAAPGAAEGRRLTDTFWLTPSARMHMLCLLAKRFNIVVPPGGLASGAADDTASLVERQRRLLVATTPGGMAQTTCRLSAETLLTYHDGPEFPGYVQRMDGPSGFRCRSTVAEGITSSPTSWVIEREGAASALSSHAFTTGDVALAPDAFPIRKGGQEPEGMEAIREAVEAAGAAGGELAGFAGEVKHALASWLPLAPVAAVKSARMLLRGDTAATAGVSIAIDEEVQFSHVQATSAAPGDDDIDFPYCLLELVNEEGDTHHSWFEELKSHAMLRSVTGFSIGAQAVASLHKERVPKLPHWYEHLSTEATCASPEDWSLMLEWRAAVTETVQKHPEFEKSVSHCSSAGAPSADEPSQSSAADQQLLPKNFLASERTMLEWINTILALAFIGIGLWRHSIKTGGRAEAGAVVLGLLNSSDASSLLLGCYSLAIIGIALGFAWYAVLMHSHRLTCLMSNTLTERVFNSRVGPTVLGTILASVLVAHMVTSLIMLNITS